MYQCRLLAVINPSLGGKVGRLGTVEAVVESSVVSEWERHNKLPSLLSDLSGNTQNQTRNATRAVN